MEEEDDFLERLGATTTLDGEVTNIGLTHGEAKRIAELLKNNVVVRKVLVSYAEFQILVESILPKRTSLRLLLLFLVITSLITVIGFVNSSRGTENVHSFSTSSSIDKRKDEKKSEAHEYSGEEKRMLLDYLRPIGLLSPDDVAVSVLSLMEDNNEVVLDVGANVGLYTEQLLTAKKNMKIIAFEPFPETCEKFENRFKNEKVASVKLHCAVCGAKPNSTVSFLAEGADTSYRRVKTCEGRTGCILLPTKTIDEVVGDRSIFILKTDTQGWEYDVLLGAKKALEENRVRFLVVEFSIGLMKASGTNPLDLLNFIYDFGYECSITRTHGLVKPGKYGRLPPNEPPIANDHTFEEYIAYLSDPIGLGSGWTDIFCMKKNV